MTRDYDQEYGNYMNEVLSYNKKVDNGRRVASANPSDPRYSQAADDARQAKAAGLGRYLPFATSRNAFAARLEQPRMRPE